MPDSKFTSWVHGSSMQVEYPDRVTSVRHTGPFVRIEGAAGQNTWLHLPVPTPTVADGTPMRVGAGLGEKDRARAIDLGPPHVAPRTDYAEMLRLTGWATVEQRDLSARFLDSAKAYRKIDRASEVELVALLGTEDYQLRMEKGAKNIAAITEGILRRDLYELRAV